MAFECYVVTHNPSDFPGKYVVRRHTADARGRLVADKLPKAVSESLPVARLAIPLYLHRMKPSWGADDPVILEWWM
jgi:hypothetical protein